MKNNKSTSSLQEYIRYSKYAKYIAAEQRRETWPEQVQRVMKLHRTKYADKLHQPKLAEYFAQAEQDYTAMLAMGSQRVLQFAGDVNNEGYIDPILKHQARVYNCVTTYLDRPEVFGEIFYLLLCGCGVGFSVQTPHILSLPTIKSLQGSVVDFVVEDSIEGWSDASAVLMASYFRTSNNGKWKEYYGKRIHFNLSNIRAKGAYISGGFKAPGPDGLRHALDKMKHLIESRMSDTGFNDENSMYYHRLLPINCYDLVMYEADAVLSGGVRRSATICMFSKEDEQMMQAKTGNWYIDQPQRGRSNNSVLLQKGDTTYEEFEAIMNRVKSFGEPGFILVDHLDIIFNPCVEIGMTPYWVEGEKKISGVQGCNLTSIPAKNIRTESDFYRACESVAILGTLQAGYTDFKYLSSVSKKIFEREALLGCSITGIMDIPDILLKPEILQNGAKIIKRVNKEVAKLIGINPAARTTCIKPEGTMSAMVGTASGCHGHHAPKYIRRVQVNKEEEPGKIYSEFNPASVEESVWSANKTDNVISFLVEAPKTSIFKNQLLNSKQLEVVKLLQQNWVEPGTNVELCVNPLTRHNVSNTVTVTDWEEVTKYIFENQKYLAGISFISHSGDKDYPQAPFTEVLTPEQLLETYGQGVLFASGLIVDGLEIFDNHLWNAIDTAIATYDKTYLAGLDLDAPGVTKVLLKKDWCRRFKSFADRYTNGNLYMCNYMLKDVNNLHRWATIESNFVEINWETIKTHEEFIDADTLAAAACSGGSCEIL